MQRLLLSFALVFCATVFPLQSQEQKAAASGHYLFALAGDAERKGNDFLAVIDARSLIGILWTSYDDRDHRPKDGTRPSHGIHHARQLHAFCQ